MANLLQLRRMVRNRLGVTAGDSFFRDDVVDDAINNAIATLESERNWPWTLKTVTLTASLTPGVIDLPSDWRSTRALYFDRHEVAFVPPYELLSYPDDRGDPSVYSHVGNELHVRAMPSQGAQLKLVYYRTPTLLETDSDEPAIPSEAYPAVVAKAAQLCSTREDDRPSAASHMLEYDQWVTRLMNVGESSKRPVGRRIRPGNWV